MYRTCPVKCACSYKHTNVTVTVINISLIRRVIHGGLRYSFYCYDEQLPLLNNYINTAILLIRQLPSSSNQPEK